MSAECIGERCERELLTAAAIHASCPSVDRADLIRMEHDLHHGVLVLTVDGDDEELHRRARAEGFEVVLEFNRMGIELVVSVSGSEQLSDSICAGLRLSLGIACSGRVLGVWA